MKVEPLNPGHIARLTVQPMQSEWLEVAKTLDPAGLSKAPSVAWAGVVGDEVIAAAGLLDGGCGRAQAWGLISDRAGPHFTALHRAVRDGLATAPYRRIEAITAANFQPARRWVEMLGFEFEGTMRAYCSNGNDALLWARVI